MRISFGQFTVDTQTPCLWKNGIEVQVREQPLQILLALLRRPGAVLSREMLREQLWGTSTYVDFDNGLNTAVSRLREALDDDAGHPKWIERVPKRGYRFIGWVPRPEAVAAYIKGHHVISPHSPENMGKALAFFTEAITLDAAYPLPYHGAALTFILRCLLDDLHPREALPKANEYLQKGLRCPQRSGMVLNTLAMLRTFERCWDEADRASLEAVALEPENSFVRMIRAQLLSCRGRHEEAVQEAFHAVTLDPVQTRAHMHLTMALYYARHWEGCVGAGGAGLEVCPDPYIGIYTSLALLELGRPEEALALNLRTRRSGNLQAVEFAFNAYIAAKAGQIDQAASALAVLQQRRKHRYVPTITLCWLEMALGHDDLAAAWLRHAYREAEPYLAWASVAPIYDRLQGPLQ